MMAILALLAFALLSTRAEARLGVDVSARADSAYWRCMAARYKVEFAVVRAYHSFGAPDANAPFTISQAWESRAIQHVDAYIFPCLSCLIEKKWSGALQVNQTLEYLAQHRTKFGCLWLDVERGGFSVGTRVQHVDFIESAVQQMQNSHAAGVLTCYGVYSSRTSWLDITGNSTVASDRGAALWWSAYGQPDFNGYAESPFGGWKKPSVRQYNDKVLAHNHCGAAADADYSP